MHFTKLKKATLIFKKPHMKCLNESVNQVDEFQFEMFVYVWIKKKIIIIESYKLGLQFSDNEI